MPRNRGDPRKVDMDEAIRVYSTGKYTIKQVGEMFGISTGAMYYCLRDAGCIFTRHKRKPISNNEREMRRIAATGRKLSEDAKQRISEKNSCNYNGLNGYGHTKNHNRGYVVVYVPKHPHAHSDGYVMFHTVIMERYIGRYLNDDEVVHHVNHDKKDNRIENLQLMKKKEHMSMHMKERHKKGGDYN